MSTLPFGKPLFFFLHLLRSLFSSTWNLLLDSKFWITLQSFLSCGNTIEWEDSVRHPGNFVDATLSDTMDCRYKHLMFIGYINKLISKFGHLQPKVLLNLFNTFFAWILDMEVALEWF